MTVTDNRLEGCKNLQIEVLFDLVLNCCTVTLICDWIGENSPYGICARFTYCAFLVAQVEICQSPDFVIYMSNNPSNCCCLLRRLVVLYEGEISLYFDPSSWHSRRTQSPLSNTAHSYVLDVEPITTAKLIDSPYSHIKGLRTEG